MQIETATLKKEKIANPHENYVQALKTWDMNRQSANECKSALQRPIKDLSKDFQKYAKITKLIVAKHAHWQIDTVQKLLQRDETFENIQKMISVQKPKPCSACGRKVHLQWACPQFKKQAKLKRYKLSRNERKDNQMGDYACRKPFQLLKDTLIPQQVFDLYKKKFIPFHCE